VGILLSRHETLVCDGFALDDFIIERTSSLNADNALFEGMEHLLPDLLSISTQGSSNLYRNVREIYEDHGKHIRFDKAFAEKVGKYVQWFATKDQEHIRFFGGNLMGVDKIRFTQSDRNRWFDEVLYMDDTGLRQDLITLPAIVETRHVSKDAMNLSCLWMAHRFLTSNDIDAQHGHEAAVNCILMLQYKFITSIIATWFHYTANEDVARATYASLSKKYGLKVYGSWGALFRARSEGIVSKASVHYKTLMTFTNDDGVVYMVNDIQCRIKDICKNIRDQFSKVHREKDSIMKSSGGTIVLDGEIHAKDVSRRFSGYRRYLHDIVSDVPSFIKPELIKVVVSIQTNLNPMYLQTTLEYISFSVGKDAAVDHLLDETLTHLFERLVEQPDLLKGSAALAEVTKLMRGVYTASRNTDPSVIQLRKLGEKIASTATGVTRDQIVTGIRTGVLLYIVLRTLTMHYYSR
jgi:hypothetical protein